MVVDQKVFATGFILLPYGFLLILCCIICRFSENYTHVTMAKTTRYRQKCANLIESGSSQPPTMLQQAWLKTIGLMLGDLGYDSIWNQPIWEEQITYMTPTQNLSITQYWDHNLHQIDSPKLKLIVNQQHTGHKLTWIPISKWHKCRWNIWMSWKQLASTSATSWLHFSVDMFADILSNFSCRFGCRYWDIIIYSSWCKYLDIKFHSVLYILWIIHVSCVPIT